MPNIDTLTNSVSQVLADSQTELHDKTYIFSTIDFKYASSQRNLYPDTAKHCNLSMVCGEMTGTYRLNTGLFVLSYAHRVPESIGSYTYRPEKTFSVSKKIF